MNPIQSPNTGVGGKDFGSVKMSKRFYIEIDGTDFMVEGFDLEDGNCQLLRTCNLSEALSWKTEASAERYRQICMKRARMNFTLIEL